MKRYDVVAQTRTSRYYPTRERDMSLVAAINCAMSRKTRQYLEAGTILEVIGIKDNGQHEVFPTATFVVTDEGKVEAAL